MTDKPPSYRVALAALAAVVALVFAALLFERSRTPVLHGAVIDPPQAMPDIVLEAGDGPMQLSSFDGKYVILVFGYTTCPDVCPITLAALQSAISELDPEVASRFQVVFVSVDYRRDSPMQVSRYARSFRPDFVGATGSEMEIAQVARDYGIYYKLNEPDPESGFYTVEHTASVLVLDPQRRLIMTWPYGLQAGELSRDLRLLAAS